MLEIIGALIYWGGGSFLIFKLFEMEQKDIGLGKFGPVTVLLVGWIIVGSILFTGD